ncbi:MAG: carboxypeptidase, partial [Proteobacteria bacterium]
MLRTALLALTLVTTAHATAATPQNRRYADIQTFLNDTQKQNPHVARVFDLTTNDTGQVIQGIALGSGPVHHLLVGTHHGNEYGSTEVALATIENLAEKPIPGVTVYIIPVLNVSGYNRRSRNEDGRDSNRDYPSPCLSGDHFNLKSTSALADFVAKEDITASITLHTFSPAVLYPWGISTHDITTGNDDQFIELAQIAASTSHYAVGNSTELLYPADGTFEDWAYWQHG